MFKQAIAIYLIATTSCLAHAEQRFCDGAYQKKLERIEKNRGWRNAGKITIAATAGAIGTFTFVPFFGIQAALLGGFFVVPAVQAGSNFADRLDREHGLKLALWYLDLAQESQSVIHQRLYEELIDKKMVEMQQLFRRHYLSKPLTREEVIRQVGPIEEQNLQSSVDHALSSLNLERQRNGLPEMTYVQYQELVRTVGDDDTFCPIVRTKKDGTLIRRPMMMNEVIMAVKTRGANK